MLMEHSGTAKDKKPEKEQEKRQKENKVGSEGHPQLHSAFVQVKRCLFL